MEFTRSSVANALLRNRRDKAKAASLIQQIGAAGEQQAVREGYADIVAKFLEDPELACAACEALSNMGVAGADWMYEIANLLGHGIPAVRAAAAEALGKFGPDAGTFAPSASSMASSDSEVFVKAAAIRMLGSVGATDEIPVISGQLEDKEEMIQCAACEALGKLGAMYERGAHFSGMLKKPSMVPSALATLADMGAKAPLEPLEAVITIGLSSADNRIRTQAVSIICNLADAVVQDKKYIEGLKSALKNSSPGVRAAGASALGAIGPRIAKEAELLLPLLKDDAEDTSGPEMAEVLGGQAARSSSSCRLPKAAALCALGKMKATGHREDIAACLNDKNWEVRLAALDAMGIIGSSGPSTLNAELVADLLGDSAFPVRAGAANALGKMGATGQVADLVDALADTSHSVRMAAVLSLAEMGEAASEYSHDVFKLIQDPLLPVRAAAVRCLSMMGDVGCNYAGVIATLLNNPDPELRAEVLDALGRMGKFGESYVEDVAESLHDQNAMVSDAAARALTAMGPAGRPYLLSSGFPSMGDSYPMLPEPTATMKGYTSALERERAKLGI